MACNPIPAALDRLFTLATDMIDGTTISNSTGVVQNTAAMVTTTLPLPERW